MAQPEWEAHVHMAKGGAAAYFKVIWAKGTNQNEQNMHINYYNEVF